MKAAFTPVAQDQWNALLGLPTECRARCLTVFAALQTFNMKADNKVFPRVGVLADRARLSTRTVQRALQELEEAGVIGRLRRPRRSSVYTMWITTKRGDTRVTQPVSPVSPNPCHPCHPEGRRDGRRKKGRQKSALPVHSSKGQRPETVAEKQARMLRELDEEERREESLNGKTLGKPISGSWVATVQDKLGPLCLTGRSHTDWTSIAQTLEVHAADPHAELAKMVEFWNGKEEKMARPVHFTTNWVGRLSPDERRKEEKKPKSDSVDSFNAMLGAWQKALEDPSEVKARAEAAARRKAVPA